MRVAPPAVIGWDMTAALAMATALGINTFLVADILPEIEAVMVRTLNNRRDDADDGQENRGAPRC